METDGHRQKIEETVISILKESDLDETTEFKVRAMAAERIGVDLSGLDHKRLIRRVVESFLLSSEETKETRPSVAVKDVNDDGDRVLCKLSDKTNVVIQEQETRPTVAVKEVINDGDRVLCKLSNKTNVAVHDFRGNTYVSIRDYYQKDGKQFPSARGISLTPEQWSGFRKSFPTIEEAISKLESRIRSEEVKRQNESETANPTTSFSSHRPIPAEGKQVEANKSNSKNASTPEGLTYINQAGANGFVPVERKETYADMSHTVIAFTQDLIPEDRIQVEADMPNSANNFDPRGLIPVETTRLDGKNYCSWVHHIRFFLKQLKIAYVLTEPCPGWDLSPEASGGEISRAKDAEQKWVDDNYICHRHILSSLSDHLFDQYSKKNYSAKQLWDELKLLYDEEFGTKRSQVSKYIQFQMVDETSVVKQVQELHNIADSFIASGIRIDENFHVSVIVSKLPPSWNEFRVKLMLEEFLPLNMLMHRIRLEEESRDRYKNVYPSTRSHKQESRIENELGPKRREMKGQGTYIGEIEKDKRGKVCYFCGKRGHISRECREKREFEIREKRNEKPNGVAAMDTEDRRVERFVE